MKHPDRERLPFLLRHLEAGLSLGILILVGASTLAGNLLIRGLARQVGPAALDQGLARMRQVILAVNGAGALLAVALVYLLLSFAKRQSRRRAEAERLYQALFAAAPDAILALGGDGRVLFANARAAALVGVDDPGELRGLAAPSLFAGEGRAVMMSHIASLRAGGSSRGAELSVARRDGTTVPVELRSSAADARGGWSAVCFLRDVSERRRREARILSLTEKLGIIARLSQRTGSLLAREDYVDLVMDSSFALIPGSMPSLWLPASGRGVLGAGWDAQAGGVEAEAGPGLAGLVRVRGPEPGTRPPEGGAVVEAYREGRPASRGGGADPLEYALPLRVADRVVGVFSIEAPGGVEVDAADGEALAVFADDLAVGLENARLYDEALERLRRLEALRTIDRAISSSMDIGFVLSVILEQATSRLGVDAADLLLLDRSAGELVIGARAGFGTDALAHTRLPVGAGLAGRVAAERESLVIPSLSAAPGAFAASPDFAAEGFAAYAGAPLVAKGELLGVLELYDRRALDGSPQWVSFFEAIAGQAAIALDNAELLAGLHRANAELREAYEATIEGWAEALELRDRETEGHSRRVTEASLELAAELGVKGEALVSLRHGALLHDIGKMGIPDAVLLKPGRLDEAEFELMKRHTTIGRDLLARLSFLGDAVDIPYGHHEKWDGTGYPHGLAGEDIPLAARLFSIVDVWDALRSDRPYREGWPEERVLAHLEGLAGSHFDPRIAAAFVGLRRRA